MEDKYLTYSSIALAGEESFVQWVRHGENELQWNRWIDAHPDNQNTIEEAGRIVHAMDKLPQTKISEKSKHELWNNIASKATTAVDTRPRGKLRGLWSWGLAAAASLALLFWFGSRIA